MPNKMKLLETPHQRKSAVLTSIIGILLLLLLFVLGLTYYDPPISFGMEVNFGNSQTGSGKIQPTQPVASKPKPIQKKPVVEKQVKTPPPTTTKVNEKVVTQNESSVAVPKKKPKKKSNPQPQKKSTPAPKKESPPEPTPEKPKIAKSTQQVLQNMFKGPKKEGKAQTGEGDDSSGGDKGKVTGSPYANSYYGNAGLGGRGGGYGLNGRSLQSNGSVIQDCNQEGTVVVRITVNQQGEVVAAQPGVKGTTNAHPCLLEPAKHTALLHRWYPDANAPNKQIGFVVIQFKLGE
jgi:outer membrane biosynthesis protein TonB